jgi:hypothetical protein
MYTTDLIKDAMIGGGGELSILLSFLVLCRYSGSTVPLKPTQRSPVPLCSASVSSSTAVIRSDAHLF